VCLSVSQASSIQNMGVTCESITVGHNPFKIPLSAAALVLPRKRPLFFTEHEMEKGAERGMGKAKSASALMGQMSTLKSVSRFKNKMMDKAKEVDPTKRCTFIKEIPTFPQDYIGKWMYEQEEQLSTEAFLDRQRFIQNLQESRFASVERFVAFLVMFHALAKKVQDWWPVASFGIFRYDMSRTQSIMRIATTASPVSGMEVRKKMLELSEVTTTKWAEKALAKAFRNFHEVRVQQKLLARVKAGGSEADAAIKELNKHRQKMLRSRATSGHDQVSI